MTKRTDLINPLIPGRIRQLDEFSYYLKIFSVDSFGFSMW